MRSNPPTSTVEEGEEYIDSSGRIAHGSSRPPLAFSSPFLPPRDPDAVRREYEQEMAKAKKHAASILGLSPRHVSSPPYAHGDDDSDRGHDQQLAERDPSTTAGSRRRLLRRRRLGENRSPEQAYMPPLPGVEPSETSAFDVVCLQSPVRGRIRPQHEEGDDRRKEDQHAHDRHLGVDIVPAAGSSSVSTPTSPCSSPSWETLGDDAYRLTDRQRRKVWEIVEEEAQDRLASESVAKRSWRVALLAVAALPLLLPLSRTGLPGRPNPPAAPPHSRFGGRAFVSDATSKASTKADRELLRETASLLARQRMLWNAEQERANAAVSDTERERARSIARGEAAERLAGLASKVEA